MSEHRLARRSGVGTVVIALILIFVGGYDVLRNTLGIDLPELDSDQVVPLIAVILGLALLDPGLAGEWRPGRAHPLIDGCEGLTERRPSLWWPPGVRPGVPIRKIEVLMAWQLPSVGTRATRKRTFTADDVETSPDCPGIGTRSTSMPSSRRARAPAGWSSRAG